MNTLPLTAVHLLFRMFPIQKHSIASDWALHRLVNKIATLIGPKNPPDDDEVPVLTKGVILHERSKVAAGKFMVCAIMVCHYSHEGVET